MNRADRDELVDQMIEVHARLHPIDLPARAVHLQPTLWDVLDEQAATEFERCAGKKPDWTQIAIPRMIAEELLDRRREAEQMERRSMMAATNSRFRLRAVAVCRYWGGCGPDLPATIAGPGRNILTFEAQVDRESYTPVTFDGAKPFVLSLACGMGTREKQGLVTYANEARIRGEDRAIKADRVRRCAQGDQTACP